MKRRVLQLIDSLQVSGGSERQAAQLAQLLFKSSRYDVFVACLNPTGGMGEVLKRTGINDIPSFPLRSFYNHTTAHQLTRFARYLRKNKIDIVHTHDFYTNVFGMVGSRLAGVPVRIASRRETTGCRSEAQKFIERRAYQFAHAIIANATAVQSQLTLEGVGKEKIFVAYNGLDLSRVSTRMDRRGSLELLKLPTDPPVRFVTILANLLSPVKDHPTFLRAAQMVRQSIPDARFIIAGEGPLKEPMQNMAAELGLANDVFFTGRCTAVAELLSLSDVCVLSSVAEGFSNSILEYMGASRPVVATAVGGAAEAIIEGETGHLVQPGDWQLMGTRILELMRNPERAQAMGNRGRQVVESKFSTQAQVGLMENLYDQLLSKEGHVSQRAIRAFDSTALFISVINEIIGL